MAIQQSPYAGLQELALFAIILLASTASDDAMADEIATATAMYPSAPR